MRLCKLKFISEAAKERVRKTEIELFRKSEFFREMKNAKKTYREFRFNTQLPAKFFTLDESLLSKIENEELLVQGVIDCILEDSDGNLHLIDYKTDRGVTPEELADRYRTQVILYRDMLSTVLDVPVKACALYSFALGHEIWVDFL